MENVGVFCEVYGVTIKNRVIEYLLENQDIDVAVGDMAKEIGISKPKAYEIINEFEEKGYVQKSRIIGKTQLYMLNKENNRIKLFLKNFEECLKMVIEEHTDNDQKEAIQENEILAYVMVDGINVNQKLMEAIA